MTVQTVRPASQVYRSAWQDASANTTNLHLDVSDDSDATYLVATASSNRLNLGLGNITLASNQRIRSVKIRIRNAESTEINATAFQQVSVTVKVPGMVPSAGTPDYFKRQTSTVLPFEGMVRTTAPDRTEWTETDINNAELELVSAKSTSGSALWQRVHELYLDVDVRDQATVSSVAVTGIGTTATPTVDWVFTPNTDGDTQKAYQVRVFSQAQYSIGGFDPATSAAAWDSGTIRSAATLTTIGVPLANTISYKTYVRAAADLNGTLWWSDFASSETAATAYEPVPTPTLTVTPDATVPYLRNLLQVSAALNLLTAQDASFEDPALGTGSWVGVNNCVPTRSTAQAAKGAASMSLAAVGTTSSPQGPTVLATIGPGTGTGGALTSASFTPPANSLLVVVGYGDSPLSAAASAVITDSLSGSWTQIDLANFSDSGGHPGYVQAWRQTIGGSPAAMTVTLDDSSGGTMHHGGWVTAWTNVNATPIGTVATNLNGPETDPAARTINITTANDHSRVAGGIVNWNSCTFTATGTNEAITGQQSVSGTVAGAAMHKTAETSPAGATSLTVTRSGSVQKYHLIAFEIRGAAAAGSGDTVAATPSGTSGYQVFPNRSYTFLGSFRAATAARTCRLEAEWADHNGTAVGSTSTGGNITDSTSAWTQATLTATSPAGAAFVRLIARVVTPGAAEVHYLDAVSMSTSSSTTWFSGGYTGNDFLTVEYADATSSHGPVVNLAHAQLASGGEASGSTAGFLVRSAKDLVTLEPTLAFAGEASLRWDVGNASGSLLDIGTTLAAYEPDYALPAVPGTQYTSSVYVRAAAGTRSLRLVATSIDSAGAVAGSATNGSTNATVAQAWQRLTVTHTAQTGAVAIRLALDNTAGDLTTYFLDAVQHEEGATATAWRPGTGITPTWQYVRGARTALTTDPRSNAAAVWDREPAPGIIRYYRASTVVVQPDGTTLASTVTAPIPTKMGLFAGLTGILKDPADPGLALAVRVVALSKRIDEDLSVLHPARPQADGQLGQRPTVLSDYVGGHDGDLTVGIDTDTDWEIFERLLARQRSVLLQMINGGQRYIRMAARSWPVEWTWPSGGVGNPRREVTVSFVETGRPPVTG